MRKFLKIFYIVSILLTANFLFFIFASAKHFVPTNNASMVVKKDVPDVSTEKDVEDSVVIAIVEPSPEIVEATTTEVEIVVPVVASTINSVPFITQAPFGEWKEEIYQDGCEEADMLMAVYWALGKKLTPEIAKEEIAAISEFEKEMIGDFRDASIADTAKVIEGYFDYKNTVVKNNVTLDDVINALMEGGIVIAPMNGQKLKNPFYTPPGPINHMLVLIGYDKDKKVFIANDSGTKHGANYHYPQSVLYEALRDYPTGFQEDNPNIRKNILIIKK